MTDTLPLKCECGAVEGVLRLHPRGRRLVCMCRSCQRFANFLEKSERILDEHGGTDIYQVTPSQIEITRGAEHLKCVRLTPKGPLRWYTGCCRTPVANTLVSAKVPFAGMPTVFMDLDDEQSRDDALGPVRYRIHAKDATGESAQGHPSGPVGMLLSTSISLLWNALCGRSRPSPFFADSGDPVAEIQMLPAG